MSVDVSQLRQLVGDLNVAPAELAKGMVGVTKRGAVNVKKAMQADFRKSRSFGQISRAVNFDVKGIPDGVEAEIGPDKSVRRAGASLAHIAYWGGANGGGGTVRDPARALEDEGDAYEAALSKLLDDLL